MSADQVRGHARLADGGLAEEIERLRAEPAEGDIAIGGAASSTSATAWRTSRSWLALISRRCFSQH